MWNQRIDRAIKIAAVAHARQKRKGTEVPYIMHPFGVAMIVAENGGDEDTVIAALLHDVLEDASDVYSAEEMERDFGPEVVQIVRDVSEVKEKNGVRRQWKERKDAYLAHLEEIEDIRPLMVATADKMQNLQGILNDYGELGEVFWERFNAGKEQEVWYYRAVTDLLEKKEGVARAMRVALRTEMDSLERMLEEAEKSEKMGEKSENVGEKI